jgi:hypothetical protein
MLISTLDKVIYYIGTFLQGSTRPLFTTQNRPAEKNLHVFFNMRVLDLDFYDCNIVPLGTCGWNCRRCCGKVVAEIIDFYAWMYTYNVQAMDDGTGTADRYRILVWILIPRVKTS